MRAAVIGGGSWGTALASVLKAINGNHIDYLVAHLAEPVFVDTRVQKVYNGKFDDLVRDTDQKLKNDPAEIKRLHVSIQDVLNAAVEGRGTTFSSYTDVDGQPGLYKESLQVFQKAEEPCPRCGAIITRTVVGGRGTHFCPRCQKL